MSGNHRRNGLAEHARLRDNPGHAVVNGLAEDVERREGVGRERFGDCPLVEKAALDALLEPLVRLLAPHVADRLQAELVVLRVLRADGVDEQPRRHVLQHLCMAVGRPAGSGAHLPRTGSAGGADRAHHEVVHLRNNEDVDCLSDADAAHAVGALREVAERHVLTERLDRLRVGRVLNVHPRGVHLVVKGEALDFRDATLGQLQHATRRTHEDHLSVELVEEDDTLHLRQAVLEEVLCDLQIAHARDEGTRVDERVERRRGVGDEVEQAADGPSRIDDRRRHDGRVGERVDELSVCPGFVVALAKLRGQQIARRAGKADAALEEDVAAQLLTRRAELEVLVPHELGEHRLAEVPVDDLRGATEEEEELLRLLLVRLPHQLQRQDVEAFQLLVPPVSQEHERLAWLHAHFVLFDLLRFAIREGLQEPASGRSDPPVVHERRAAQVEATDLLLHGGVRLLHDVLEIGEPQPLVAVGENRQPDHNVRVRELAG